MTGIIDPILNRLRESAECRERPDLDDIDAANLLFEVVRLRAEFDLMQQRAIEAERKVRWLLAQQNGVTE